MTGLFVVLPELRAPRPVPAPVVIRCAGCGSPDWWRCVPGEAPLSEIYAQKLKVTVLRSDDGVPPLAWCRACDPELKGSSDA